MDVPVKRSSALRSLAGIAALAVRPAATLAQAAPQLRIGVLAGDASAEPLYAQQSGIFKHRVIAAQLVPFANDAAVLAALTGGSIDVGYTGVIPMANAINADVPILMLAPAAAFTSSAPDVLLYRARGSALASGADLKGKTIAVAAPNSLASVAASTWIDANGGDAKTAKFVTLAPSLMANALAQKTVDAAVIPEPDATVANAAIEKLGDAYGAIATDFTVSAFIATADWAAANDDLAKQFVAAIVDTAHWANAHRTASAKFLTAASDLDPSVAAAMTRTTFGETISAPTLAPPLQAAVTYGALAFTASVIGIMAAAQPYWSAVRR